MLDSTDYHLLALLQEDAKRTYEELGHLAGLSLSAVKNRFKKIRQHTKLTHNSALPRPQGCAINLCVFIAIKLRDTPIKETFNQHIRSLQNIHECHFITGKYAYLLKGTFRNETEIEQFVHHSLYPHFVVEKIKITFSLYNLKEPMSLNLMEEAPP